MIPLPFAHDCPQWLDYIRSLPSVESGGFDYGENGPRCVPHHPVGHGRLGNRKCSDFLAIPLTDAEHKRLHQEGWPAWEERCGSQLDHAAKILAQACNDGLLIPNTKALRLLAA